MALKLILALTILPLASCSRLPPLRGLAQVRLDDAWLQRPVGPRRGAPGQKPPDSGNITAVKALDAISRHWLIYERIFSLALRAVGGASKALRHLVMAFVHWPPRVAVCELRGVIASDTDVRYEAQALLQPGLLSDEAVAAALEARKSGDLINMQRCERQLEKAFRSGARAVALRINSPGGSPSQSSLIYRRLRELRRRHPRVKLLAFVEDAAASGGYYIASCADEIIVDDNAIVGSVGVISRGFGYVRQLRKAGVERRVHTAGDSKAGLDPFLSMKRRDLSSQRRLLEELHSTFIEAVETGRGDRLKRDVAARLKHDTDAAASMLPSLLPPSRATLRRLEKAGAGLFDGSVYSGATAVDVGLADRVGELKSELQRRYGRYVQLEVIEPERPVDLNRLMRWLM